MNVAFVAWNERGQFSFWFLIINTIFLWLHYSPAYKAKLNTRTRILHTIQCSCLLAVHTWYFHWNTNHCVIGDFANGNSAKSAELLVSQGTWKFNKLQLHFVYIDVYRRYAPRIVVTPPILCSRVPHQHTQQNKYFQCGSDANYIYIPIGIRVWIL